jgi:hypothetical protein
MLELSFASRLDWHCHDFGQRRRQLSNGLSGCNIHLLSGLSPGFNGFLSMRHPPFGIDPFHGFHGCRF